jgi:hypothetical protein
MTFEGEKQQVRVLNVDRGISIWFDKKIDWQV